MTPGYSRPRARRILLWSLPLDLLVVGVLGLGLWPVASDLPRGGATTNTPGDGGLRRPLPALATRPTTR